MILRPQPARPRSATRRACLLCLALALIALSSCRRPISTAPDREAIAGIVSAFHQALANGDGARAMALLAPDAQILESGQRQTREQYAEEHLDADIAFAKAVPSTRGAMVVRQEGSVAWVSADGKSAGTFQGKPVESENVELMVLAQTPDGWRIRAIHWSSHAHSAH